MSMGVSSAQIKRDIAIVRDPLRTAPERAVAAASLAQSVSTSTFVQAVSAGAEPAAVDSAQRMFGYNTRHSHAVPWDGRGVRSGTVTYVDDERVEQYVGRQTWIAYELGMVPNFAPSVGDQVRISRRGSTAIAEAIGQNRLQTADTANVREIRSGLVVVRASPIDEVEIESVAQALSDRYGGVPGFASGTANIAFREAAKLRLTATSLDPRLAAVVAPLLREPPAGAARFDSTIRSNGAEAAADAERALMLGAAMFASEGTAVALDDSGAILAGDELLRLAVRNEMRADRFSFVAAAAQRLWPCPPRRLSGRQGVCDEVVLFSGRAWRADSAAAYLRRSLDAIFCGAERSEDPNVPREAIVYRSEEQGAPGTLQPIAALAFETVDLEVAFIDMTCAGDDLRTVVQSREAVEALLGRSIASAIVFTAGNRSDDTESACFLLEMRRADSLATALAAAFARRDAGIAADANGNLFSADELIEFAIHRSGKQVSPNIRFAAAADAPLPRDDAT